MLYRVESLDPMETKLVGSEWVQIKDVCGEYPYPTNSEECWSLRAYVSRSILHWRVVEFVESYSCRDIGF